MKRFLFLTLVFCFAFAGIVFAADTTITFDVDSYADGVVQVSSTDTNDAVMTLSVDVDTVDTDFIELDGVNETLEFKQETILINGADPATTTAGAIALDTDDDFIEFYTDASFVIGAMICETATISDPAQQRDIIVLKHFGARAYPQRATTRGYTITASAAVSDTHTLMDYASRGDESPVTSEAITLSSSQREENATGLDHDAFAADSFLVLDMDAATDDTDYLEITYMYTINPGN